jgi:hypothetical protein
MKWLKFLPITLALAAGAVSGLARAEDASDAMWKEFYKKLAFVARGGNNSTDMVVSLAVPGTPLGKFDPKSKADLKYMSELVDRAAELNPVWRPSKDSLSKVYGDILGDAKADPPTKQPDAAALKKAMDYTDPDGEIWNKYIEKQAAYAEAAEAIEASRWEALKEGDTSWEPPRSMRDRAKNAMTAWESAGKKNDVEAQIQRLAELTSMDPATWWTKVKGLYADGKLDDENPPHYKFSTFPKPEEWTKNSGWLKFSYKNSEKVDRSSYNSRDMSLSASVSAGGFKGSLDMAKADSAARAMASDNSLEITMEIKRVYITRPWLNWGVFTNPNWEWNAMLRGQKISDGAGKGMLPVIPDSFIIVRNVKFKADSIASNSEVLKKSLSGSVKVSYGPFSCSASYSSTDNSSQSTATVNGSEIQIKSPQIIAWISTVVPKAPAKLVK